jgi:hypothetical protein
MHLCWYEEKIGDHVYEPKDYGRRKRKKRGRKRRSTEAMKELTERRKAPGMM